MLTDKQRGALEAKAKERGVDPAKLIAEAEAIMSGGKSVSTAPSDDPGAEKPKLFMYLLPFVTVREVRERWLGLMDSFPGGEEIASAWAAKQGGSGGSGGSGESE